MLFNYFKNIEFNQPWWFILLLILPVLIWWYISKNKQQQSAIILPDISAAGLSTFKTSLRHFPFLLRLFSIACIICALAKPQTANQLQQTQGEGIDIVLCLDVSGSMTAQDFQPNRLEAAKSLAIDFIGKRKTDNIGVVIFAGESFTQCPLTADYAVLQSAVQNIHNGLLDDGTAIGDGLATSVDRIRKSKAKSKVIILLTDGENNGGDLDPDYAKEVAKAFAVKVYTIGVGTNGYAQQPINTPLGVQMQQVKVTIDEKLLTQIATETGGQYFRATDNNSLQNIYSQIDALEKSKTETTITIKYTPKFLPFIIAALFFILLEVVLRFTVLKKFP
ncbi:MAG: VWA domain-containing protein [Ferruginibacter sp.]|nr:VWA domain-containing protein [Ferruginibacter sp.]